MRYRLVQEEDLPACLDLLDSNGRCVLSPRVRAHLPRLWADWLAQDRHAPKSFVLWEDLSSPNAPRVEAIGTAHFVHDAVYDLLMREPQPYLIERLYSMVLDGHQPFLDQREIAHGNAGEGLSLLMSLYLQREHDLDHPDSQRLRPLGAAHGQKHSLGKGTITPWPKTNRFTPAPNAVAPAPAGWANAPAAMPGTP